MARPIADIEADLVVHYEARRRVARNQSYTIGNRTFTMANAATLHRIIKDLEQEKNGALNAGTIKTKRTIFRD